MIKYESKKNQFKKNIKKNSSQPGITWLASDPRHNKIWITP